MDIDRPVRHRARLPLREPWVVLLPLVAIQWAAVLAFALTTPHNGWLFYQGGDQTWLYTRAWGLANGELAPTYVGYAWPFLLTPIALLAGPSILAALPAILAFQFLFLLPLGVLCVYGIAAHVGGRVLGYWAAGAWVAVPFVAMPLWDKRYEERYEDQFLPQAFGLTGMADFPSMIFVLVSAYFVVRAIAGARPVDAVLAGLAAGFAAGMKPANLVYLPAPFLALALARRWRSAVVLAAALVPALVTLTLWKVRGLGQIPAFAAPDVRLAAGASDLLAPVDRYLGLDWNVLSANYFALRELFWNASLLVWLPLAGLVAVARRSIPVAVLLFGWLAAYVFLKGTDPRASVDTGSFFRLLMPAWPAFLLLAAAVPLLVPTLAPRIVERFRGASELFRPGRRTLAVAAVALALLPVPLVLLARPLHEPEAVLDPVGSVYVPVTRGFGLGVDSARGVNTLSWRAPATGSSDVFYVVYRSRGGDGTSCDHLPGGASYCSIRARLLGRTRATTFVDEQAPPEATYRVGAAANYRDDPRLGDLLLLSDAASSDS